MNQQALSIAAALWTAIAFAPRAAEASDCPRPTALLCVDRTYLSSPCGREQVQTCEEMAREASMPCSGDGDDLLTYWCQIRDRCEPASLDRCLDPNAMRGDCAMATAWDCARVISESRIDDATARRAADHLVPLYQAYAAVWAAQRATDPRATASLRRPPTNGGATGDRRFAGTLARIRAKGAVAASFDYMKKNPTAMPGEPTAPVTSPVGPNQLSPIAAVLQPKVAHQTIEPLELDYSDYAWQANGDAVASCAEYAWEKYFTLSNAAAASATYLQDHRAMVDLLDDPWSGHGVLAKLAQDAQIEQRDGTPIDLSARITRMIPAHNRYIAAADGSLLEPYPEGEPSWSPAVLTAIEAWKDVPPGYQSVNMATHFLDADAKNAKHGYTDELVDGLYELEEELDRLLEQRAERRAYWKELVDRADHYADVCAGESYEFLHSGLAEAIMLCASGGGSTAFCEQAKLDKQADANAACGAAGVAAEQRDRERPVITKTLIAIDAAIDDVFSAAIAAGCFEQGWTPCEHSPRETVAWFGRLAARAPASDYDRCMTITGDDFASIPDMADEIAGYVPFDASADYTASPAALEELLDGYEAYELAFAAAVEEFLATYGDMFHYRPDGRPAMGEHEEEEGDQNIDDKGGSYYRSASWAMSMYQPGDQKADDPGIDDQPEETCDPHADDCGPHPPKCPEVEIQALFESGAFLDDGDTKAAMSIYGASDSPGDDSDDSDGGGPWGMSIPILGGEPVELGGEEIDGVESGEMSLDVELDELGVGLPELAGISASATGDYSDVQWNFNVVVSWKQEFEVLLAVAPVPVGPMTLKLQAGIVLQVGVELGMSLKELWLDQLGDGECDVTQLHVTGKLTAFADFGGFLDAAIGWPMLAVGVGSQLSLIRVQNTTQVTDSTLSGPEETKWKLEVENELGVTFLRGKIYAVIEIAIFRLRFTIIEWDGFKFAWVETFEDEESEKTDVMNQAMADQLAGEQE